MLRNIKNYSGTYGCLWGIDSKQLNHSLCDTSKYYSSIVKCIMGYHVDTISVTDIFHPILLSPCSSQGICAVFALTHLPEAWDW